METKHTPGPWRVQATGDAFIVEHHTHTESFSIDENGERCVWSEYNEANARLIAAAPELLEALKLIANAENSALDLAYCKGIARAAIAKATT